MELAIPLATFIVALTAVIVSVITLRWGAKREYVRSLEKRIVYLENKLTLSEKERQELQSEISRVRRDNHELLSEVHDLRKQVESLQTR
jgi:peptidoglycan hydrolase CwlO-like protein